jgi:ribose-phosphate pyrophosphokinase
MTHNLMICAGSSNPALATEITNYLGIPLSPIKVSRFTNDNLHVQILESVRERDVFVIQSFTQPVSDNIIELLLILDALRSASAQRITAVIPYYSYARSDKKDKPRISIAGRLMADLLVTSGANRVLTMDLHADQVHGFFSVPTDHLTALPVLCNYFRAKLDLARVTAVAADVGAVKRVGTFARRLGVSMAFIDKRRLGDTEVEQKHVVGEVDGRDVIIFDDEISTGTTLANTVKTLQRAGAQRVFAGATHGVLCGDAIKNVALSNLEMLAVANTAYIPDEKRIDKLTVLSVAPLFAQAIHCIHNGESVSGLFRYD